MLMPAARTVPIQKRTRHQVLARRTRAYFWVFVQLCISMGGIFGQNYLEREFVPYMFNLIDGVSSTADACKWWEDVWAWNIPSDTSSNITFCHNEPCCSVGSDCIKRSTTPCRRQSDASYITITTLPLDWFLVYTKTRNTEDARIEDFSSLKVCAGSFCNVFNSSRDRKSVV